MHFPLPIKRVFLGLVLLVLCKGLGAQVFIQRTGAGQQGEAMDYVIYGGGNLSDRIPYSKITGSPFWNGDWQWASLYAGSSKVALLPVRLNLVTSEIHYQQGEKELVLLGNTITRVMFHKEQDTTAVTSLFERGIADLLLGRDPVRDFVQVMNRGKFELLKYTRRKLAAGDSLFQTQKRYYFKDEVFYFLRTNGEKVIPIKKLHPEPLLVHLNPSSVYTKWLQSQKLNLRKEEDVIQFLNHINQNSWSRD